MKTKTQYLLSTISVIALLAVNYYVSSTTVKYNFSEIKSTASTENKKIDKVEIKEVEKQTKKKSHVSKNKIEEIATVPSLFEMSQELGVPLTVSYSEEELSYPE